MLEILQLSESDNEYCVVEEGHTESLMLLSTAACDQTKKSAKSMVLQVQIQGQQLLCLVDSGSSACFIDSEKARLISGRCPLLKPLLVKVAGGAVLQCTEQIPNCTWSSNGHEFTDSFCILPLKSYDGIIGLDWLTKNSPMITHWDMNWIAVHRDGEFLVLHGEGEMEVTHAIIELHIAEEETKLDKPEHPPGIQNLLDQFAAVFEEPTGLPPSRQYDHRIPLIPGAQPISLRPYRVAPELKK
uniref:Uncharacterized protein n=1 Tax=Avena sativa TaxID=4498 RepID=A0ACD5XQA4_AVESA